MSVGAPAIVVLHFYFANLPAETGGLRFFVRLPDANLFVIKISRQWLTNKAGVANVIGLTIKEFNNGFAVACPLEVGGPFETRSGIDVHRREGNLQPFGAGFSHVAQYGAVATRKR